MKLGQEVLNKISDLLVEIDRPKSPKKKKIQRNPRKDEHNDNNQHSNRLYENHRKMKDKIHEKQRERMLNELSHMQHFKVQNKHSIFLNSKKSEKPLYQRTQDIIQQRQVSMQRKKLQVEIERQRKRKLLGQQSEEDEIERELNKSSRKVSKKELDEILNRLTQKERERNRKYKGEKMQYLRHKLLNAKQKPDINQSSSKIFQKKKIQKSLSSNVFQRLDRYQWEQRRNHEQYVEEIKRKQTPFRPVLSKNTREIARNMTSRTPLNKQLDRSISCKCFTKNRNSQRDLTPSPSRMETSRHLGKSSSNLNHRPFIT